MMEERLVELREVIAALAFATDHWHGARLELGFRSAIIAAGLAREVGLAPVEARVAYYLAMMSTLGCVREGEPTEVLFGDLKGLLERESRDSSRRQATSASADRQYQIVRGLFGLESPGEANDQDLTPELRSCGEQVARGYRALLLQWCAPEVRGGGAFEPAVALARVAIFAAAMSHAHGTAVARVLAADPQQEPSLLAALERCAAKIIPDDAQPMREQALQAEPGAPLTLNERTFERVLRATGDYADLISDYFSGHSARVAAIADRTASLLGLDALERRTLRRAAYVHAVGRISVPAEVWNKKEPLSQNDRERIHMHAYASERILAHSPLLNPLGAVVGMTYERLDRSGYPRQSAAMALPIGARVLAVANVLAALGEPRPHRDAMSPKEAASLLRTEASLGRLDANVVEAALAGPVGARRSQLGAAALTARQLHVLRLVARGFTNKEIAETLGISPKTAGRHVEMMFAKIGVKTRAAAAHFAFQNGLAT